MKNRIPKDFYSNFLIVIKIVFLRTFIELKKSPGLLLFSLIMSISLWVFVTDTKNPQITETFPVSIVVQAVNVGPELAVANRIDTVQLRVSASQNKLASLTSNNFNAFVDLNGFGARQQDLPVRVDVEGIRGVKVVEIIPANLKVNLENLVEKQVNVDFRAIGSAPIGYKLGKITPSTNVADISGPESLVNIISSVVANINITGLTVSLDQSFNLTPRSNGGSEIQGVVVNPESTFFNIEILKTNYVKTVPVEIDIIGGPSYGYKVSGIDLDPVSIKINGSINELQNINSVNLNSINIDGRTSSLLTNVPLPLSDSYTYIDITDIKIAITIVPIYGSIRTTAIPQIVGNEDKKLEFDENFRYIELTLRGPLDIISKLQSFDIKSEIDISSLEVGEQTVRPKILLPDNIALVSSEPSEIIVQIYELTE
ncbi:MAG: CdaR family protein [Dehalococcoidia bacterium]|nr:CdaR family protein [Dehalococcoidia bacterium]